MKAWHWVGETLRDGRPVPKDGVKLVHPGKPKLCEYGLHASLRPWDALNYAPGGVLCLVAPSRFVLTVLHTMHVDGVFPIFDDDVTALRWAAAESAASAAAASIVNAR